MDEKKLILCGSARNHRTEMFQNEKSIGSFSHSAGCSRQALGEVPSIFLKIWEKCAGDTKPTVSLISETDSSDSDSSFFAFSQRTAL